jgi:hypothetical protein
MALQDHGVAVAVDHEDRFVDRRDALEQRVVRLSPGAHGVVLHQPGLPTGRRVAVGRACLERAAGHLLPRRTARLRVREKDARYSAADVSGFHTAPITSGAQPCIPLAPCGAKEASTRLRMIDGRTSASSWATKLPSENPSRSTSPIPRASMKSIASSAICATVLGVVPLGTSRRRAGTATSGREHTR